MSFIDRCLNALEETPDYAVVTEIDGTTRLPLTGTAMARRVRAARAALRRLEITRDVRVVLAAPRGAAAVAVEVALVTEGAIIVPIDPTADPEHAAALIRQVEPAMVVVGYEAVGDALKACGVEVPIRVVTSVTSYDELHEPPVARDPDDAVAIFFTRGRTGKPRPVVLTAGNFDYVIDVFDDVMAMATRDIEDTRVFLAASAALPGANLFGWTAACTARRLMFGSNLDQPIDEIAAADPHFLVVTADRLATIADALKAGMAERSRPIRALCERAEAAFARKVAGEGSFVGRAVIQMARRAVLDGVRKQLGGQLQRIICVDTLPADLALWLAFVGFPTTQIYGLAEASGVVALDKRGRGAPGVIGPAVTGCEAKVSPDGELLVRGPNVFQRYWGDAEASDAALVDGWLKTGDRASIDSGGRITILPGGVTRHAGSDTR